MNLSAILFATTIALLTICYLIYCYFQRSFDYWTKRFVGHPKPSFPFGNFNRKILTESGIIVQNIYNELRNTKAKFGGYNMLTIPVFIPLSPILYKEILVKSFNCFHDHGIYHNEEIDPFSAHIIAVTGTKWKHLRNKLFPAFSSIKLKMMFPIMQKCSTDITEIIEKSSPLDIQNIAARYTTDMICSCAFGIDGNSLKNPNGEFMKYGKQLVETNWVDSMRFALSVMAPQILETFKIKSFNPKITDFFYKIVEETIEYRVKNNIKRNDLMDMLIRLMNNESIDDETNDENVNENGEALTINQIAAQVFIFYIAGFETSATALTFCMYELAKHQDIQDKLRDEIEKVLRENNGEITFEGINNLQYADKVIQETMRMHPPIVMLNRICTEDFKIPESLISIEKGTRVVISTLGTHFDPEYYPNPHNFDPERFSEEEMAKRPQMTYFPFGDGPRICLGQRFAMIEQKLALMVFLRSYKYVVDPSTRSEIRTINNGNMLGLKDKIWLKATKL